MEIFNIHIFEFLLIAGLALIVFGPERLPEVGRFVGKQVARFLAWQQQSPELKMITDVRSEFEREIASLRDELVRTRKQLDLSQDAELKSLRDELRPMLNLREEAPAKPARATEPLAAADPAPGSVDAAPVEAATVADPAPGSVDAAPVEAVTVADAAPDSVGAAPVEAATVADAAPDSAGAAPVEAVTVADAAPDSVDAALGASEAAPPPSPALPRAPEGTVQAATRPNRLAATEPTTVLERPDERLAYLADRRRTLHDSPLYADESPLTPSLNGQAHTPAEPPISADEVRALLRRLEALSADVQALISGLHAQGVLGVDWQPEAAINEQESLPR